MEQKQHPEYGYLNLAREVLETGEKQVDKGTGVATYSLFGRQIRFDLSQGFPLLTTKRVYWSGILHECYWFFSGQTNIKYLVDHGVHIWDDYPYKIYNEAVSRGEGEALTKEEFVETIEWLSEEFTDEVGDPDAVIPYDQKGVKFAEPEY